MENPKSEKRTGRLGFAPTMASAASLTGLDEEVVKAAKGAGCGAFRARGDVDCDALLEWIAEHPEIAEGGQVSKALEEALKTRAQRRMVEHKLDEAKRRVIPVDEVKRTYTRSVVAGKSKLLGAKKSIAMKCRMRLSLNDEQVAALEEILDADHREVARELSKGEWFEQSCPHCEHPL